MKLQTNRVFDIDLLLFSGSNADQEVALERGPANQVTGTRKVVSLKQQQADLIITARQGISATTVLIMSAITGAAAVAVYWLTSYPNIAWWSTAGLATAANCLGVLSAPGALIPTILGWIVIKLPIGLSAIRSLNFFAGLIGAVQVVLVGHVAMYLLSGEKLGSSRLRRGSGPVVFGAIMLTCLGFAWGDTLWRYATMYTEYVFTPLMTVLIVWSMLRWWEDADEPGADRWLFASTLLFGLDVSVHRTNLLLLPGILVWLALRRPKVFASIRSWVAGWAGLALGLAFHLLIIPMAGLGPYMNMTNPSNLSRFWDYVSLKQSGGGFLINLYPRNGNWWDDQVMDWVRGFAANFAGGDTWLLAAGWLALALGLLGLIMLFLRRPKLGAGMLVLFLLSSAGAILYFNVPADYFRSMWRHYLPSMILFAIFMAYGAGSLMAWVTRLKRPFSDTLGIVLVVLIMILPVQQFARNYRSHDNSQNYIAIDWARNLLMYLPPKAILFTQGDNDTFPLWYLQQVQDERRDVTVLNLSLLNTGWYVDQMKTYDPSLPITLTSDSLEQIIRWSDSSIVIPAGDAALRYPELAADTIPDSIVLHVAPTIAGKFLMNQDRVLLDILQHNEWYRPIFFSGSTSLGNMAYLQPHVRMDGLVQQFLPVDNPPEDRALMTKNLMENYSYRSFNDPAVPLSRTDLTMGPSYYRAFLTLVYADYQAADTSGAAAVCARMKEVLPVERLHPPENLERAIEAYCAGDTE